MKLIRSAALIFLTFANLFPSIALTEEPPATGATTTAEILGPSGAPIPAPRIAHAQLGFATNKLLQQFHLPSSPEELIQFLLEYALKQKLGNTLPLDLNANDAYPAVPAEQLPGGPFHGKPVSLTAKQMQSPLAPGDYLIPVMAYCTQYSVHRPGAGTAYALAPVKGTHAEAIATLLWRGTLAGVRPQDLQATSWAIQAGVTYGKMPKPYQATVDQLIPDYKTTLQESFLSSVETTYTEISADPRKYLQTYIKERYKATVPIMLLPKFPAAPPLDVLLARMGPLGLLVLDAQKQSNILLTSYTTKELGEQTLFQGQGQELPPVPATEGTWTVSVPGLAYTRLRIVGGNMQPNNILEVRIVAPTASTQARRGVAHLLTVSYDGPALATSPQATVYSLMGASVAASNSIQSVTASGIIGYAQGGGGAQAQIPVPVPAKPPCNNPDIVTTYDPSDTGLLKGYHAYHVDTRICLTESAGCTVDAVFQKMLSQSNFAAPTADTTPITQCKKTTVQIVRVEDSVDLRTGPIQTTLDSAAHSVTNYTLPGHPLHPGEVTRTVLLDAEGGWVHVLTTGQGTGWLPDINEKSAHAVWDKVDARLKDAVSPQPTQPKRKR